MDNYIIITNPRTKESKSLIEMLLEEDENQTGGKNAQSIQSLLPHEQYAIFMRSYGRIVERKSTMWKAFKQWLRENNIPITETKDTFVTKLLERYPNVQEVKIGTEEYLTGIAVKSSYKKGL